MVGRATEGSVDGRRQDLLALHTVEGLVESLDTRAHESLGVVLLSLRRDELALLAQVVGRVHHVVVAAPGAGADRRVARPGDGGEVHDRSGGQNGGLLPEPPQVGKGVGIALEPVLELRRMDPIDQENIEPIR